MTISMSLHNSKAITGASVSLRGVTKAYGKLKAVDNLSLDIEPGEFVSLLGPSGSGKTSTLMMLAGFEKPTRGTIILGGEDITHKPPYKRNIGTVYQNYALFPHMTVAENIAFPLRMRGLSAEQIRIDVQRALSLVRLEGMEGRFPQQLSGGQQQRVAIARALVFKPPLLLMDEPLGALDKKLREELQVEIKRIQDLTGSTIIYVTHDQDEALRMSDRVVVMNKAVIEHVGKPSSIYDRPNTRFVADFLGSANFLEGKVDKGPRGRNFRSASGLSFSLPDAVPTRAVDVTVVLRPERIRMEPAAAERSEGRHRGHIAQIAYQGHSNGVLVKLETGEPIMATLQSGQAWPLEVGMMVDLWWDTDTLHLLEG